MTLGPAPETGALPRRGRRLIPASVPRRGEVLAVFAVTIVAGHLVFAPVTLVVAIVLAAAGKASRWRLWWLLLPAGAGLAWLLALGPGTALAGFTAWPSGILGSLHGQLAGPPGAHRGHPPAGLRLAWHSLPAQLPVALICGAAEAAVLGWLVWLHTDEWALPAPRPGALAAVRGRLGGAAIRAGAVLTRYGCALGVVTATGAVAELSWAEMAGGLLITGDDPRDVTLASLQVVHAALRRRKALIVIDLSDAADPDDTAGLVRALTAACLATGTSLRTDGAAGGLAAAGDGPEVGLGVPWDDSAGGTRLQTDGSAAGLVASADGAGAGFEVVAGSGAQAAGGRGGASASRLWGRAREDPPGSPRAVRTPVDLHQVIQERSAARLPADSPEEVARACADLAALAQHLRAIGVDGDGLIWIPRGELVPAEDLAALLRDAPAAGLPVLIGATSPAAAADLAGLVGAMLTLRVTDPVLASRLAELTGTRMVPASAVAALAGMAGAPAGSWSPPGMPTMPTFPAPPATAMPAAASAQSVGTALPGVPAMQGTDLVRCPVIPPRTLHALRRWEFVLAVNVPRRRVIALGRLIPARLPRRAEPPHRDKPPYPEAPLYQALPSQRDEPLYREAPLRWTAPGVDGR